MMGRLARDEGAGGAASVTGALRWGFAAMLYTLLPLLPSTAHADEGPAPGRRLPLPESPADSEAGAVPASRVVAEVTPGTMVIASGGSGAPLDTASGWRFTIAPYLWMPRSELDLTVGDLSRSATLDFSQVVDDLRFGVSGHFEATWREWTLLLDALYFKLEKEAPTEAGVPTEIDFEEVLFELGGTFRLVDLPVGGQGRITLEALAGGRLMYVDAELSIGSQRNLRTATFVDPMVGGRIVYRAFDRVTLWFRADVAGFGISDVQSQLTYNLVAGLDWRLARRASASAGWRYMRVDFGKGGGTSRFAADLSLSGPFLGFTLGF
jgi:hypothetical protein